MTGGSVTVSVSGSKEDVVTQLRRQVANRDLFNALETIVREAPGTHASLSGFLNTAVDDSHGSISLSGSFWTP